VVGIPFAELDGTQRHEVGALLRARLAVLRAGRLVLTSRGMELHSAVSERLMR
jgi:hypothetical protein